MKECTAKLPIMYLDSLQAKRYPIQTEKKTGRCLNGQDSLPWPWSRLPQHRRVWKHAIPIPRLGRKRAVCCRGRLQQQHQQRRASLEVVTLSSHDLKALPIKAPFPSTGDLQTSYKPARRYPFARRPLTQNPPLNLPAKPIRNIVILSASLALKTCPPSLPNFSSPYSHPVQRLPYSSQQMSRSHVYNSCFSHSSSQHTAFIS